MNSKTAFAILFGLSLSLGAHGDDASQAQEIAVLKGLTQQLLQSSPDGQNIWRRAIADKVCKPKIDGWRTEYAASPQKANYDAAVKAELARKWAMPGAAQAVREQRQLLEGFVRSWKSQLTADDIAHMQRASALVDQRLPFPPEEKQYAEFVGMRMKTFAEQYFRRRSRYFKSCRNGDSLDRMGDECIHDPGFFFSNQIYMPQVDSLGGEATSWEEENGPGMSDTKYPAVGVAVGSARSVAGPDSNVQQNSVKLMLYPRLEADKLGDDWFMLQNYLVPYQTDGYATFSYREYESGDSSEGFLSKKFYACLEDGLKNSNLDTLLSSAVEGAAGARKTVAQTTVGVSAPPAKAGSETTPVR